MKATSPRFASEAMRKKKGRKPRSLRNYRTLEDIGKILGVSKQYAQKLERTAIRKIRERLSRDPDIMELIEATMPIERPLPVSRDFEGRTHYGAAADDPRFLEIVREVSARRRVPIPNMMKFHRYPTHPGRDEVIFRCLEAGMTRKELQHQMGITGTELANMINRAARRAAKVRAV